MRIDILPILIAIMPRTDIVTIRCSKILALLWIWNFSWSSFYKTRSIRLRLKYKAWLGKDIITCHIPIIEKMINKPKRTCYNLRFGSNSDNRAEQNATITIAIAGKRNVHARRMKIPHTCRALTPISDFILMSRVPKIKFDFKEIIDFASFFDLEITKEGFCEQGKARLDVFLRSFRRDV